MRIYKTVLNQDMESSAFNFAGVGAYFFTVGHGEHYGKDVYTVAVSRDDSTAVVGICPGYGIGMQRAYDEELSSRLAEYGASADDLARAGLPPAPADD
ncbi:hypothetical protein [Bifidobacterium castoris]|uniref:Uncharacterized protein n=1 Tax=Bifidobacterium castoris TaxID=2306972 RepID=A0A430F4Z4_9BIFI|nr:hypothetical protein [Bifidobacterium castoris]RSX44687.1 hypothetical protein D2E22_1973 [Bifidobacterium castoris]